MEQREVIEQTLPHFFGGSERFTRYQDSLLLTDGARYVAEACEAFWLMDIIWSVEPKLRHEPFWVVELKVSESATGQVIITDGNDNVLYTQALKYTDFPLPEIKLYAEFGEGPRVVMLPEER